MFQIKICGITNVADAEAAATAGADAIGLNFYMQSSRCIDRATARKIAQSLGTRVVKVGVFVNAPIEEILATCDDVGLDLVQLHGDERPDVLRPLAPRPVMKAFRVGPEGLVEVRRWLETCLPMSIFPRLVLLDAFQSGQYGGTGATGDWPAAAAYAATTGVPPLVLAGGLTPVNVAEAIRRVRPAAVDTAGGVESAPGRKDAALVKAFTAAARAALDEVTR